MDGGKLVFQKNDTRVPWRFYKRMHQFWEIAGNDVLLAIVGATIGKVAMVPQKMNRFTLQRSVAVLRGKRNVLENKFLFLYFCSEPFKIKLWQRVNQTAQPGIYLDEIAKILVPIPPFKEQLDIYNAFSAVDIRIQNEEQYLAKLKLQKKGLMHDLLTGKVRVKVDSREEETPL
jgi:type I restriction enzyme S subunit